MGDEIMMNKKGGMALRDIMFAVIIFAAVMALISIFVLNMSDEYENTDMTTEYNSSVGTLGSSLYRNVNESLKSMTEDVDESTGSFGIVTNFVGGIPSLLKTIILSPVYVKVAMKTMMTALYIPDDISDIISNLMMGLIYIIIIFVIVSALSRGGTKL